MAAGTEVSSCCLREIALSFRTFRTVRFQWMKLIFVARNLTRALKSAFHASMYFSMIDFFAHLTDANVLAFFSGNFLSDWSGTELETQNSYTIECS